MLSDLWSMIVFNARSWQEQWTLKYQLYQQVDWTEWLILSVIVEWIILDHSIPSKIIPEQSEEVDLLVHLFQHQSSPPRYSVITGYTELIKCHS